MFGFVFVLLCCQVVFVCCQDTRNVLVSITRDGSTVRLSKPAMFYTDSGANGPSGRVVPLQGDGVVPSYQLVYDSFVFDRSYRFIRDTNISCDISSYTNSIIFFCQFPIDYNCWILSSRDLVCSRGGAKPLSCVPYSIEPHQPLLNMSIPVFGTRSAMIPHFALTSQLLTYNVMFVSVSRGNVIIGQDLFPSSMGLLPTYVQSAHPWPYYQYVRCALSVVYIVDCTLNGLFVCLRANSTLPYMCEGLYGPPAAQYNNCISGGCVAPFYCPVPNLGLVCDVAVCPNCSDPIYVVNELNCTVCQCRVHDCPVDPCLCPGGVLQNVAGCEYCFCPPTTTLKSDYVVSGVLLPYQSRVLMIMVVLIFVVM